MTIFYSSAVNAYPGGAPSQACTNLRPQHGGTSQTSSPPYELDVDMFQDLEIPEVPVTYSYSPNSSYNRKTARFLSTIIIS